MLLRRSRVSVNQGFENARKQETNGECSCGGYITLNEDHFEVCTKCGTCFMQEITNKISLTKFTERFGDVSAYNGYDRMKYFKRRLRYLEARQRVVIPKSVLNLFKNVKIEGMDMESRQKVETILRDNGLAYKYYRHVPLIIYILTGKRITFHPQFRIDAYRLFDKLQKSFKYYGKKNKKKFVPFDYIMQQICMWLSNKTNLEYNPLDYLQYFKDFKLHKNYVRNLSLCRLV